MVIPTPRTLLLATCGVIPVVLSGSHTAALTIAAFWLAGTTILVLVDAWFAPPAASQRWIRENDTKLSLGTWNSVTLRLDNRAPRSVTFRVRDAAPQFMLSRDETAAGECRSRAVWEWRYQLFPLHRGDFRFSPLAVRYLGPLGLAWRQRAVPLEDRVQVYPDLLAVRGYEALIHRGRLAEIGLRNSRRRGQGTEFERLRNYTSDDEFRRINWKATARRMQPIVADYQTERSQNIIFAIDAGRLMATRVPLPEDVREAEERAAELGAGAVTVSSPRALTRLDYSLNSALLLGYVAQEFGDRVGLLAFSDRITRYLAPRAGRSQFLLLTHALYNLEAEPTASDFTEAIAYLGRRNPRRSLIVFFTDLAEPQSASQLVGHIGHLLPRHLPLVVTLQDPSIERLASLPVTDSESVYQHAVARRILDDRNQILLQLRQRGILTLDVPADRLSPSVINRYLEVKARGAL